MKRLLHWSDLHIGASPAELRALHALVAHVLARPDLDDCALAVTGDITDDAQPHQWRDVQHALAPLIGQLPIFMVPGNHDVGLMGCTYDPVRAARSREAIDALTTTPARTMRGMRVWEWAGHKILGLDSCRGQAGELPPLARGEIGPEQLGALEVELMDEVPTLVLLHHHPRWHDPAHILEDARALIFLIERRSDVRAVMFGHQHVEQTWGRPSERLWISSGKTTVMHAGRLSYRELALETLRIEYWSS